MQVVVRPDHEASSYRMCEWMQQSSQKEILEIISRGVELINSPHGCELIIDNMGKIQRKIGCNCQACLALQDLQNALDEKKKASGLFYQLPKIIKGGF